MLKHYIKLTVRNLTASKGYFLINLLGLITGITAFLLIVFWIKAEVSFDKFHENAENIYRVDYILYEEDVLEAHSAAGSAGVGREIKNMFPEVLDYTRFVPTTALISHGENLFKETGILFAQSSFFDVFTFPLVAGKADSTLLEQNHAILTESAARKYFGDKDPLGKTIKLDGNAEFEVTGVVKDVPENSHFDFDILLSYDYLVRNSQYYENQWVSEQIYTYVLLNPEADVDALQAKLSQIPEKFFGDFMKSAFFLVEYQLRKITDIHLHSSVGNELKVNGSYRSVVALGIIAMLVLIIAFINYINLATSRAIDRTHEIGIRKVSGAMRKDLLAQFLTESTLQNFLALVISITVVIILFPLFKSAMQSPINADIVTVLIIFIVLLVAGSLITGMLPATYISGLAPAGILRSKGQTGSKWIGKFKNSLVVFQFCISVILIGGTLMINRQLNYMNNYDIGMDIKQILVVEGPRVVNNINSYEDFVRIQEGFKNDIIGQPAVVSVTASSSVPGNEIKSWRVMGVPVEGRNTEKRLISYAVESSFFDTYGLKMLAGHGFTPAVQEESHILILNESALAYYDFQDPEDAIGRKLTSGDQEFTIIGVVNDFNQQSLKKMPEPIGFYNQPSTTYYSVKANMSGVNQLIPELETIWKRHYPGNTFNYFFLNDHYKKQYESDQRFGNLFLGSSILAISIACLGLLGLSAYSISKRIKEIGIRKVNGAKVSEILAMLNKDFIKWVAIAFIIATPITYYAMNKWLQNFAYKTTLSWWIFALAGLLALGIALLTVSFQSWKAATKNPVEALRYE